MLQFGEIMFINKKTKPWDFQMLHKNIKKNLLFTTGKLYVRETVFEQWTSSFSLELSTEIRRNNWEMID